MMTLIKTEYNIEELSDNKCIVTITNYYRLFWFIKFTRTVTVHSMQRVSYGRYIVTLFFANKRYAEIWIDEFRDRINTRTGYISDGFNSSKNNTMSKPSKLVEVTNNKNEE